MTSISGTTRTVGTQRLGGFFTDNSGFRTIFPITNQSGTTLFITPPNTSSFGTPVTSNFTASGPVQVANGETRFPLVNNTQNQAAFLTAAQQRFGPGFGPNPLTYVTDPNFSRAVVQPGTSRVFDPSQGANIATFYDYTFLTAPVVPQPGFLTGKLKISENNNPFPRDRFILNYDYFSNTPLGTGTAINRYVFGFEKTFFNQNASIEVRLPVAYTLSSDIVSNGVLSNTTELGNMGLAGKLLLYSSKTITTSVGLGITLPTADDVRVRLVDNTDLVRINNRAIFLTPFLGVLFTPNNQLFAQFFTAFEFDTNGNPVNAATNQPTLSYAARVNDQTLAQLDAQIGYWVLRSSDPSRWVQGLAPFLELHYNAALNNPDVVMIDTFVNQPVQIGQPGHINELNLTAGWLTQIGTNFNLLVGVVAPLRNQPDRTFDYQIGVRGNLFFGATARSRSAAVQATSF